MGAGGGGGGLGLWVVYKAQDSGFRVRLGFRVVRGISHITFFERWTLEVPPRAERRSG